jgi:hypothetical protein
VLAAMKKQDHISPLDDLAFAMYQDPEISTIIRSLDKKKAECVLSKLLSTSIDLFFIRPAKICSKYSFSPKLKAGIEQFTDKIKN